MRRILSKHDEEKRKKRNQSILAFFLLFIMFASVLGYGLEGNFGSNAGSSESNATERANYNGFEFTHQNGLWILKKDGFDFLFKYNPEEAGKTSSTLEAVSSYKNKPLYIFSESFEAESEVRTNLASFAQRIQNACPENETCESNVPVKTCEDNFIIIRESENAMVYQEEGCVFIEGQGDNLAKMADGFLLKIMGVR